MSLRRLAPPALLLALILPACSSARQAASSPPLPAEPVADTPAFPIASRPDGGGQGLLYLFEGTASLDGTASIRPVPLRTGAAIGDTFLVDLTSILDEGEPCGDCVRLTNIAIDGDRVNLTLAMRHPFGVGPPPGDPNFFLRNDLHVFDVRGTMAPQTIAPAPLPATGLRIDVDGNGTRETDVLVMGGHLLNPDGYSAEFQLFAEPYLGALPGNVHPYRDYFWDPVAGNYSASNPNGFANIQFPTGQNVFAQGTTFTSPGASQTFRLQTIDGQVNFFFMVSCAYGQTATFARTVQDPAQLGSRSNPKYFLPAMHRPEAVRVGANMSGPLGAGDPGSTANLTVTVTDWQGARLAKEAPIAIADPPDTIAFGSNVQEVVVVVPGVLTAPVVRQVADTGDGSPANPYRFVISLPNQGAAPQGVYPGFVAVRDELSLHVPAAPMGVGRDLAPLNLREFTTFQAFAVQVGPPTSGRYDPDPDRLNIDLTDARFADRTGIDVELEVSVVSTGDPSADGVYLPATANNGLVRYTRDYQSAELYGAFITPLFTSNIVPDPENPPPGFDPNRHMPIVHVDLGLDAVGMAAADDAFKSMRFSESETPPGTQTGERDLSNSNLLFNYYRALDPPPGIGPVLWFEDLTSPETGQPFAFLPGVYNDNPGTPENEFLNSLAEDPIPADCFEAGDQGDGFAYYGAVWVNANAAGNGNRPFQVLRAKGSVPGSSSGLGSSAFINQLNFGVPELSGEHILAADLLFFDDATEEVWLAFATNRILGLRWLGVSGNPGASPEGTPRGDVSVVSGLPIDLEMFDYDPASPLVINGSVQSSPILVVLTDAGTVEIIHEIYSANPLVMQTINLAAAGSTGIPQHLDLDEETSDIHVTAVDGTIPRMTVLSLQ